MHSHSVAFETIELSIKIVKKLFKKLHYLFPNLITVRKHSLLQHLKWFIHVMQAATIHSAGLRGTVGNKAND